MRFTICLLWFGVSVARSAILSVCVTGTCPSTNNYRSINDAINALSKAGDIIEVYPGQGDGTGSNGVPAGAYCGGQGNCSAMNPINLKFYKFAESSNPFIIRTHRYTQLPGPGNRITPEYADGTQPITALVWNVGSAPLIQADYGIARCMLPLADPVATGAVYLTNVVSSPDNSYMQVGNQITEDSSDREHKIFLGFTSSSSSGYQATVLFAPLFATTLSEWILGAGSTFAKVALGSGISNGDYIQVDQEIMQVTAGGGSTSLSISRGQQGSVPQPSHYQNMGVINLTAQRRQAFLRIGDHTCIVDFAGNGTVVSATEGSTCTITPWGHASTGAYGMMAAYWYYVTLTLPGPILDQTVYAGIASNGATSYPGNGSGAIYIYRPSVVEQQSEDGYRCPAYGYSFQGLELNGGTGGSAYGLVQIPNVESPDWNFTQLADAPHDITFDRNLFRETLFTTATRQCLNIVGRRVTVTNNYFGGCIARDQADGAVSLGGMLGPALFANNYVEAISSGLNTGPGGHIRSFPISQGNYFYMSTGCNAGCNGTIEVRHNYIYKPAWVRSKTWTPNTRVSPGSIWYPTLQGPFEYRVEPGHQGTTGPVEPAWNLTPGGTTTDGTVTWITEAVPTPLGWNYAAGTWLVGQYLYAGVGGLNWQVTRAGTTTGSGVPSSPAGNASASDGGTATLRAVYTYWKASTSWNQHDVIQNLNGTSWRFVAQSNCTTGSTPPSWNQSEGATTSDGTCTWRATSAHQSYPSKNLQDIKSAVNQWYHHNYYFNSFAQNAQGGGQGNAVNFQALTGQGFPYSQIADTIFENSVIDTAQVGMLLNGKDGDDSNKQYCTGGLFVSTDPRCPLNTYGMGYFNNFILRNVRISNINNDHDSPNFPTVFGLGGLQNLTIDHVTVDAPSTYATFLMNGQFPNHNMKITNSIFRPGSGTFFRCSYEGIRCGNSTASTTEFAALNYAGANEAYAPGAYAAGTYPNPNAAYTEASSVAGNVFSGGTSYGRPTAPPNTGADKLPSNNQFTSWPNLGLDKYYRLGYKSALRKAGADSKDPGPDQTQQPVLLNAQVVQSDRAAAISFDMTSGSGVVTPVIQLSTSPDFDLSGPGWVPSALDPSVNLPDAGGNTNLSADYDAYPQSGLHRTFVLTGLDPDKTYYYRVHGGGQMISGSFVTESPVSGSRTVRISYRTEAADASDLVIDFGNAYSRLMDTISGGGTTPPVVCAKNGAACTVTFPAEAGIPVYYRCKIRDSSGNVLVTLPVEVRLP